MNRISNPTLRRRGCDRRGHGDRVLLLMIQMWMLTATLEAFLAGHHRVASAALLSSLALFAVCGFLYRLVLRIDRAPEPEDRQPRGDAAGPWRVGS